MIAGASGKGLLAGTLLALGATGTIVLPQGRDAGRMLLARENPEQLTALALARPDLQDRLAGELKAALDADDIDLAGSVIALAGQEQRSLPPDLLQRFEVATTTSATVRRNTEEFYRGAIDGKGETTAGMAGVITTDLIGVGDLRDLSLEGAKILRGEEPDQLVLGLAAIGLVITGATIISFGAASPARAGVSTIKVAARSGRLSKPLTAQISRMVGETIDRQAVNRAASAGARLELNTAREALRSAIRPAALSRLGAVAGDVGSLGAKAGLRGAQDALALARNPAEIARLARLAEKRGTSTRAILKLLGRGAIVIGASALTLAGWAMAGVIWLLAALFVLTSVVKFLARRTTAWIPALPRRLKRRAE